MSKANNKNMIWIATANLIYPETSPSYLVSASDIRQEISRLFSDSDNKITTTFQLTRHLISWRDKDSDTAYDRQGGDRSRFLFQTSNGKTPSSKGKYRLYKKIDGEFDGSEKTGTIHPPKNSIPVKFHFLIDWYAHEYYAS